MSTCSGRSGPGPSRTNQPPPNVTAAHSSIGLGSVVIVATTAASFLVGLVPPSVAAPPVGPGVGSHFDLARKDCLGTARNTTSKIWYTVAGGVLSDVYNPTVDNTNVQTMQFLVTDGHTFTDLERLLRFGEVT